MALRNIVIATDSFEVSGESTTLRGLGFADLVVLYSSNQKIAEDLFMSYTAATGFGSNLDAEGRIIVDFLVSAPNIAAQIIAMASDEPEMVETAARLPMATQIEALEKIVRLTLATEGGLGKLVETVKRVFEEATSSLNNLKV